MNHISYTYNMLYIDRRIQILKEKFLNTQKRRERYRSELRAETLSAARNLIQEEGYEGLTLRKLAQRMECSPMALYTYFSDKQALLLALAQEGFVRLAKRLESTARRDPLAAVRKMLLDYIAYAEENPVEYRILFMSVEPLAEVKKTRQGMQESNPAFSALFKCVETCLKAGVLQGDAFAVSTVLWTGAHGAAALLNTAQNFPFGNRRRYAEEVVETILSGAQNRVIERV
jgi:AcrR family transcriptional regulator